MLLYEQALRQIIKYLSTTSERGIIDDLDPILGIQCYVDADFAGSWSKADADNPENVMLCTGFVIMYAGCPVLWQSKLQMEIALSTAEANFIVLSSVMQEVILPMNCLEDLASIFHLHMPKSEVHYKVFKGNKSCITITKTYKFSPRTKHIALKYHHYCKFVVEGKWLYCPFLPRNK
eukprot:230953-Ditylum_brightwellii.AAC.1